MRKRIFTTLSVLVSSSRQCIWLVHRKIKYFRKYTRWNVYSSPTATGDEHTNEVHDVDSNRALDQLEAENGITLSLAVYNHTTGNLFLHKGDQWTYEASIVKVPISLTLLRLAAFEQRELPDEEMGQCHRCPISARKMVPLDWSQTWGSDSSMGRRFWESLLPMRC